MVVRYRITVNGGNVLITDSYRHAAAAYNKAIYHGKPGDIIRMMYRDDPNKPWQTAKKDWL